MNAILNQIAQQVLQLAPAQRAELVELLIESLESTQPDEIQHLWVAEASRRLSEVRCGSVKTISGEEVVAEARHLVKR
jgi:putative addiction module component (TIGR02574 family)